MVEEYTIRFGIDECSENPRRMFGHLGKIITFHRRYDIGDNHEFSDPQEMFVDLLFEYGTEKEIRQAFIELCKYEEFSISEIKEILNYKDSSECNYDIFCNTLRDTRYTVPINKLNFPKDLVVLPVYAYEHSGITISTSSFSCRWDSGQIGIIYASKSKNKDSWGSVTEEELEQKLIKALNVEIKELDAYLTGQVYFFEIRNLIDDGVEDSCYGFYGNKEELKLEALASLKSFL